MATTFTPEQIAQILEEFFKVVGTRQYVGARYVPIFGRKGEDSIEWDNTAPYEPLTIVLYQGNSYTSRQYVPVGVEIDNQEFWAETGNYNAQVEQYRREVLEVKDALDSIEVATKERALPFDSARDMQSAELYEGAFVHTDGFNAAKSGGAAWYKIASDVSANGFDALACGADLVALLQDTSSHINVSDYGVDLTGNADASSAIQYVIDKYPGHTIYFPNGDYKLLSTVNTWPDNERSVNLIFGENARFFTTTQLECLFYIGGYDLEANYGTTATLGHKKFFVGGRFDGTGCEYAVKMSSGTCDQQFVNCMFYNCNSGLLMGHVTRERSIDSVIAYCNFIGTGAFDSYGIRYMKPDNKIQHCRIYGFKTCISQAEGGLYAFDIHTLDMSQDPTGYDCDDSCVVDLPTGGRNTLIAVYGNGEGTFCRVHGEYVNLLKIVDCEYRNWTLSASDFVFVDIINDGYTRVHATITGNTVIADNPYETGKVRYGIRGLNYSDDIAIADNVIWGSEHFTDKADPILLVNNIPYLTRRFHQMKANWWYYVGSLKLGPYNKEYNMQFNVGLNKLGFALLARNATNPVVTYAKYIITPYVPNEGVYHIGHIKNGENLDFYVYSETAQPGFSMLTCFVEEVGKRYYLANKYKDRGDDAGYSQEDQGGSIEDLTVDVNYSFNMQMSHNGTILG